MKTGIAIRTAAFLVVVPGTVVVIIPMFLVFVLGESTKLELGGFRYAGMAFMVLGAAIYLRCASCLTFHGMGVPAPWEPTRHLVRKGMYRGVRNPMYLAGSLFLFGQAVALEHGILLVWAASVTMLYHMGVVFLEEPALKKRFGESYVRYCNEVPRWLPRLRAPRIADSTEHEDAAHGDAASVDLPNTKPR